MDYYTPDWCGGVGEGRGGGFVKYKYFCIFLLRFFFLENITGRLYNIQNSKLCFCDMKLCHSGMVVILVNNSSCGLVVYRVTTIPS